MLIKKNLKILQTSDEQLSKKLINKIKKILQATDLQLT